MMLPRFHGIKVDSDNSGLVWLRPITELLRILCVLNHGEVVVNLLIDDETGTTAFLTRKGNK